MQAIRSYLRQHHVAILAIFLALTAGAQALPGRNTVDSGDIKPRAVKRGDLARNSVNAAKIVDGSVKGAEVNEATLGTVPSAQSAAQAGNADTLDGADSAGFLSSAPNAVTGTSVEDGSLTGSDIDESTLAVGAKRVDSISWGVPDASFNQLLSSTTVPGTAELRYDCPGNPDSTTGNLEYHNLSSSTVNLFVDSHDGTAPTFVTVGAGNQANNPVPFGNAHLTLASGHFGTASATVVYDIYTRQTGTACLAFGTLTRDRP